MAINARPSPSFMKRLLLATAWLFMAAYYARIPSRCCNYPRFPDCNYRIKLTLGLMADNGGYFSFYFKAAVVHWQVAMHT